MNRIPHRVLIVTGSVGLSSTGEPAAGMRSYKMQWDLFKSYKGAWLDIRSKLELVELFLKFKLELKSNRFRKADYRDTVKQYLRSSNSLDVPELTEVILATLLQRAGIEFQIMNVDEVCALDRDMEGRLEEHRCVFLSSTLLRDLNELELVAARLKRPKNRVVVGGALTGFIWEQWRGSPWIDVLAVGYGEYLVPTLADWIRDDFKNLKVPPGGHVENRGKTEVLFSGIPSSNSLDELPTPDWRLAEKYHQREFPIILYESVRGCPYRCGFCNYPYLFNDSQFRIRSAERIVEDWEIIARSGVKYISCLDSLFTLPRQRLIRLCRLLVKRNIQVNWICFARADDLIETEVCELMRKAGCVKVAIGIESGSQKILDNMNKRCTVENNALALNNCRSAGLVTSVSLIVGYPGEDSKTVRETFEFLKRNPPDIFHIYPLAIRAEGLPLLDPSNKSRFALETFDDGRTAQPYWRHQTMCCNEAIDQARWLRNRLMSEGVALEGALFYANSLNWNRSDHRDLLEFQKSLLVHHTMINWMGEKLNRLARWQLARDLDRKMPIPSHSSA